MTIPCLGLDFGTTNSAVALALPDRSVRLAEFPHRGRPTLSTRSVLFFDPEDVRPGRRPEPVVGNAALQRSMERDGDGRFIQSTKSWLASRGFDGTDIFGHRFRLPDLIAAVIGLLRSASLGWYDGPLRVVAGRPVRFARADDPADDAFAEGRLRDAFALAGFPDLRFELEPVGAAWHYANELDHDELVLIGDFGGGTSDFTLVRVGPSAWAGGPEARREVVLGIDGVGLAGDAFDARIIRHAVAGRLGQGGQQRTAFGAPMPLPGWVFIHLERWHQLSLLGGAATRRRLQGMLRDALDPQAFGGLVHLVEHNLGFALYEAVQAAKNELSRSDRTRLLFVDDGLTLDVPIRREEFEEWIAPELAEIDAAVQRLLANTGIAPDAVDRVFLTGGSSFVPSVRALFAARFGVDKLASGHELTSVARGLALSGLGDP